MRKIVFILFFLPLSLFAQQDKVALEKEARQLVREGNELYNQLKFADAEVKYKKALEKNPDYEIAKYNLGNALSQQNRTKEAIKEYELVAKTTKDNFTRASSMHNIGNAHYQDKDYQKAVDSYKHSLRANPEDDETRYNLALAQEMLKNQEQNEDKDKDKKDNKDDKNKDKDKKDDKKEGDDKKDEDKKNDKKNDKSDPNKDKKDDKKEQKPQQGKLSPQQVKQLLDAMNNEEQKTQKKMNAKKERGKKIKQEKDW
ncbi:MAG: tetratricopeptide repeat protein [Flavobacteriaceae bacterium]|nr:tetratricopeptide repeat protein [Flavobacteriaceae bacterium]